MSGERAAARLPRGLTARTATAGALLAAAIAGVLVVLLLAVADQRDNARAARHSEQVRAASATAQGLLIDLETGVRGLIITGQRNFLDPYTQAHRHLPGVMADLQRLVAENPAQLRRARRISAGIRTYERRWSDPLAVEAARHPDVARVRLETGIGKVLVDQLRSEFAAFNAVESDLSAERDANASDSAHRAILFAGGAIALTIALVLLAALYMGRAVVVPARQVATAARRVAGGDLTARVESTRRDELGDLARSFDAMAEALQESRAELEERNADLERSNAELEQFASVASHDLSEPLRGIAGFAELLERRHGPDLDPQARDWVRRIRDGTERMRVLIDDLLAYARAGNERERVPVDVGKVVERVRGLLGASIESRGGRLVAGALPVVWSSEGDLLQIFQNLVGNAVKFSGETPPVVEVQAERERGAWRFAVADNGIGIEPQHASRVFGMFERLHPNERYPGTGMGLAITERIVTRHGGRIWVESAPGRGSTFNFTIPDVPGEPASGRGPKPAGDPWAGVR
jgi:signal transduction histidine kinase